MIWPSMLWLALSVLSSFGYQQAELEELTKRSFALRCTLLSYVLSLRTDAKLSALVKSILVAKIPLDDASR